MTVNAAQADAFYEEVLASEEVWALRDDNGFPAPENADGQRVMPFWSKESRVASVTKNVEAYRGFEGCPHPPRRVAQPMVAGPQPGRPAHWTQLVGQPRDRLRRCSRGNRSDADCATLPIAARQPGDTLRRCSPPHKLTPVPPSHSLACCSPSAGFVMVKHHRRIGEKTEQDNVRLFGPPVGPHIDGAPWQARQAGFGFLVIGLLIAVFFGLKAF